jgi:hypothetical protein
MTEFVEAVLRGMPEARRLQGGQRVGTPRAALPGPIVEVRIGAGRDLEGEEKAAGRPDW